MKQFTSLSIVLFLTFCLLDQQYVWCNTRYSQLRSIVPTTRNNVIVNHLSKDITTPTTTTRRSRRALVSPVKVTQLFLIDTDTGNKLMELVDGSEYDIAKLLPSTNFTIHAIASGNDPTTCYMLNFDLDNGQLLRTDSIPPYTLIGNVIEEDSNSPNIPSGRLQLVGQHVLLVTPQSCPTTNATEVFVNETLAEDVIVEDPTVKESATVSIETLLGSERSAVEVDEVFIVEDEGALQISFTVYNGAQPLPPTPAPVPVTDVTGYPSSIEGSITGNLTIWNTVTISFKGPLGSEQGSSIRGPYGQLNTYKDFRCEVTFIHDNTDQEYIIRPCYFNLDGNPANSANKALDGDVWTVHFIPQFIGTYTYVASFVFGTNSAPNGGGDPGGFFHDAKGIFEIKDQDIKDDALMLSTDLRRQGKLMYVGKNFLQFASSKGSFIASGPDSPENLLAYQDFDDTSNIGGYSKSYLSHIRDFVSTDAAGNTWDGGKGTGIIGAINYLASKGMNTISITTLTIDGVDRNVHPFSLSLEMNYMNYDASKLSQWNILFDWLSKKGIVARVKLQDAGSDDYFDEGKTLEFRRLYYREMIARFGHHLGVIWDLGEDITNVNEIKERAKFIKSLDPYTPIMVQTIEELQSSVYGDLLSSDVDCISIVSADITKIGTLTAEWARKSAVAGKPFVITNDKQGSIVDGIVSDTVDKVRTSVRQNVIWNPIMYGGSGSRYYFGSSADVTLQDFRSRDSLFTQASLALKFFTDNGIPLADMQSSILSSTGFPMLKTSDGQSTVIYKGPGFTSAISIPIGGSPSAIYAIKWYSPSTGKYVNGSSSLTPGTNVNLGSYPAPSSLDWVALVTCTNNCGGVGR